VATVPSSRKRRQTYDSLVEAARLVMGRTGSLSPEAIAEAARVSPATFYTYFDSKDAMLAAAFDSSLDEMYELVSGSLAIETVLDLGLPIATNTLTREVVSGFSHDARLFRLAIARVPESEELREVYHRQQSRMLELLTRFVRLGIKAGKVRSADPEVLARAMLITLFGFQHPMIQHASAGPVVSELAAMLHRLLVTDI
jgi:AcrR family transcriptional regulator